MKTKLLILLAFSAMCSSCRTVKEVPVETKTTIVEKLTPVYLPPDSAAITALLGCDSLNNVFLREINELKTKNVQSSFSLQGNQIVYRAIVKHDTVYIKGKDIIIDREVPVKVEVLVEIFKLTRWEMVIQFFGYTFMSVLAIIGIIALLRWKFGR